MLEEIITQLGYNYKQEDASILIDLIKSYTDIALNISNNKKEILMPYIKEAVISHYLRLGNEGMSGSNEGSISSSYIDIQQKLRNDIVSNNLRRIL